MIILNLFLIAFFVVCYAVGGQGHKWIRRFLGPGVFGAGLILLSILKHHFGVLPVLAGAWYIPSLILFKYGVNDGPIWKKVFLRGVYGASLGVSGLLAGIAGHNVLLGVAQLILATATSILFGVLNPFSKLGDKGVILEDACIAFGCVFLVPFIC